MTHDHAVRVVVSLVPEIEKRGAAKALLDYAEKEDLPPAQLEKLAQVFNTLRTVSHIDNAEPGERGATVPLLDVPELVVGYATGLNQEKAARAPTSAPSHDPASVDLNRALWREMNPAAPKMQKEASAAPKFVVTVDQVADAMIDLELEYRDVMSKCASELFSAAPKTDTWERDISEFEKEALYLQPAALVKAAGDFMEKFAAPHRVRLIRHDYGEQLAKRAFDASTAAGEKFAELAKATQMHDVIVKMAAGGISHAEFEAAGGHIDVDDPSKPVSIFGTPDPEADPNIEAPEKHTKDVLAEAGSLAGAAGPKVDPTATRPPPGAVDYAGGPGGPGGGSKDKKDKDKGESKGKTKDGPGFIDVIGAPIKATADMVQGAARKADDTLVKITSKERDNKAQRRTDLDVADIRRAINLRRMIGTDPVLREADPRDVLDIYNSITEINPELAGNMTALRLILREAVSYEGLTLDSQKLLADIGKSRAEAEKAVGENDKRRYAVGGSAPLSVLPDARA
jgi:hypothetical protein